MWSALTIALAGPRWNFREMEVFSRDQSLVILLDLSESMNATDTKPSRLIRAKQKIEDLLKNSQDVKVGLIAFAADAHMITPITEDKETIRHLLPSLSTELVHVQGSRLSPALVMASTLLEAEAESNKAILVFSDGGFEDSSAMMTAKKLGDQGIIIHVMGVGTYEGTSLYKNQVTHLSKLEKEKLNEISKAGNGYYLEANRSQPNESIILNELKEKGEAQLKLGKTNRQWEEQFYLLIIPVLPILLWWFRRGYIFAAILLCLSPSLNLEAFDSVYFKNSEQIGKQAYDEEDYETAINTFQDPYRKGVACYKAKNFAEAERLFRESSRSEVDSCAIYNLGNALAQQEKFKEAMAAYETVLEQCPNHLQAKENLEMVRQMLQDQKNNSQSDKKDQQNNQDQNDQGDDQSRGDESKEEDDEKEKDKNSEKEEEGKQSDQEQSPEDSENENSEHQEKEDSKDSAEEQNQQDENDKDHPRTPQESPKTRSQDDQDADLWLNRITNDPSTFLKNKFYIESRKNATKEGVNPW